MKEYLDDLGDHFIGLWKLSPYQGVSGFCVTVCVNGKHWDTESYPTPELALFVAKQIVKSEMEKEI